jgi:hypothetical protein
MADIPMHQCSRCRAWVPMGAGECAVCATLNPGPRVPPLPVKLIAKRKNQSRFTVAAIIVGGGLVWFAAGVAMMHRAPGPETSQMTLSMKGWLGQSNETFYHRFGEPSLSWPDAINNVHYMVSRYQCSDGDVTVWDNRTLGIIEGVHNEGNLMFAR